MPRSFNPGYHHCDNCKTNLMACDLCPRCGNPTKPNRIRRTRQQRRRQRLIQRTGINPFDEFEVSGELAAIKKRRWSSSMGYSEE